MPTHRVVKIDELAQYFNLPEKAVARQLGVCLTSLKKICRQNGITRWPYRKLKSLDKKINKIESAMSNSAEDPSAMLLKWEMLKLEKKSLPFAAAVTGNSAAPAAVHHHHNNNTDDSDHETRRRNSFVADSNDSLSRSVSSSHSSHHADRKATTTTGKRAASRGSYTNNTHQSQTSSSLPTTTTNGIQNPTLRSVLEQQLKQYEKPCESEARSVHPSRTCCSSSSSCSSTSSATTATMSHYHHPDESGYNTPSTPDASASYTSAKGEISHKNSKTGNHTRLGRHRPEDLDILDIMPSSAPVSLLSAENFASNTANVNANEDISCVEEANRLAEYYCRPDSARYFSAKEKPSFEMFSAKNSACYENFTSKDENFRCSLLSPSCLLSPSAHAHASLSLSHSHFDDMFNANNMDLSASKVEFFEDAYDFTSLLPSS